MKCVQMMANGNFLGTIWYEYVRIIPVEGKTYNAICFMVNESSVLITNDDVATFNEYEKTLIFST